MSTTKTRGVYIVSEKTIELLETPPCIKALIAIITPINHVNIKLHT